MKLTVKQLRRIIKEEVNKSPRKSSGTFEVYIWNTDDNEMYEEIGVYPSHREAINARNAAFSEQLESNGMDMSDFLADNGLSGDEATLEDGHLEYWVKKTTKSSNLTVDFAPAGPLNGGVDADISALLNKPISDLEESKKEYTASQLKSLGFIEKRRVAPTNRYPIVLVSGTLDGAPAVAVMNVFGNRKATIYK